MVLLNALQGITSRRWEPSNVLHQGNTSVLHDFEYEGLEDLLFAARSFPAFNYHTEWEPKGINSKPSASSSHAISSSLNIAEAPSA